MCLLLDFRSVSTAAAITAPITTGWRLAPAFDVNPNLGMRVFAAYASGIAQATLERIQRTDLRGAKVPLRIVLGRNDAQTAIITLDEAGRIRVAGDLSLLRRMDPDHRVPTTEAGAFPAAAALVEKVLGKTLDGWGVTIRTDDRGQK